MSLYLADSTDLTAVASAIRTKGGTSAQLEFPDEFVSAIAAIPTGGPEILVPDTYTQLEYIENDGHAYLNTGLYWQSNSKIVADIQILQNFSTFVHTFGSDSVFSQFPATGTTTRWASNASVKLNDANYTTSKYIPKVRAIHQLTKEDYIVTCEGKTETSASFSSPTVTDNSHPIGIFTRLNDGSPSYTITGMKLYRFQFFSGESKVMDLSPAIRNADNVIGAYDIVTNTFFVNSGSGAFTGGSL